MAVETSYKPWYISLPAHKWRKNISSLGLSEYQYRPAIQPQTRWCHFLFPTPWAVRRILIRAGGNPPKLPGHTSTADSPFWQRQNCNSPLMRECFTNNFSVQSPLPCQNLSLPQVAGQGEVGVKIPESKTKTEGEK